MAMYHSKIPVISQNFWGKKLKATTEVTIQEPPKCGGSPWKDVTLRLQGEL